MSPGLRKHTGRADESLLERESEANSVRKADISTLPYIEIPLDTLPVDALSACGHFRLADELHAWRAKKS